MEAPPPTLIFSVTSVYTRAVKVLSVSVVSHGIVFVLRANPLVQAGTSLCSLPGPCGVKRQATRGRTCESRRTDRKATSIAQEHHGCPFFSLQPTTGGSFSMLGFLTLVHDRRNKITFRAAVAWVRPVQLHARLHDAWPKPVHAVPPNWWDSAQRTWRGKDSTVGGQGSWSSLWQCSPPITSLASILGLPR